MIATVATATGAAGAASFIDNTGSKFSRAGAIPLEGLAVLSVIGGTAMTGDAAHRLWMVGGPKAPFAPVTAVLGISGIVGANWGVNHLTEKGGQR
jgi:hypothetical protein